MILLKCLAWFYYKRIDKFNKSNRNGNVVKCFIHLTVTLSQSVIAITAPLDECLDCCSNQIQY